MAKEQYVVGLDLGSYFIKASAVTGKNGDIIFSSYGESSGIVNGVIKDEVIFLASVRDVLRKLEIKIGQPVKNVYLSVDIGNTANVCSKATTGIVSEIVTDDEINRAITSSMRFPRSHDMAVADISLIEQKVDGNKVNDPNGINGTLLDIKTQIFFVKKKLIVDLTEALRKIDVEVYGTGVQMRGVSNLIVTASSKEKGIVIIDCGHSKTDMAIYKNNEIVAYNSIDIAGINITRDLSIVMKISMEEAEEIKIQFGNGLIDESNKKYDLIKGVIMARIDEILDEVKVFIKRNYVTEIEDCCVFGGGLCGFKNINKYLEEKLKLSTNAITSDIIRSDDIFTLASVGVAFDIVHDIQTELQLQEWDKVLELPTSEDEKPYIDKISKLSDKAKKSVRNIINVNDDFNDYEVEDEIIYNDFTEINKESYLDKNSSESLYSERNSSKINEYSLDDTDEDNVKPGIFQKITEFFKNLFARLFKGALENDEIDDEYHSEYRDSDDEELDYLSEEVRSIKYDKDEKPKEHKIVSKKGSKDKFKNIKNRFGIE